MAENILLSLFFVLFAVRTLRNVLYNVFLWQLKEYRLDRMVSHLKTYQGKKLIFGKLSTVKWLLLILGTFVYFDIFFVYAILLIYLFESILNLKEVKSGLKKPVFTPKAFTLVIILFLVELSGAFLFLSPMGFLIFDKLLGPISSLLVGLISIPSKIAKKILFYEAKNKLNKEYKGKVIGITGSVGKTSVKEFTSHILSSKFHVQKTEGSQNTDIAIAKLILNKLSLADEIFIVEMAAYKRGEIKSICNIVKPDIGVVTDISPQHIDLFGSFNNIIEAKFELVESLKSDGLAIFNGDNSFCLDMAKKAEKLGLKTDIYTIKDKSGTYFATDIKIYPTYLQFNLIIKGKKYDITANLLGRHNIYNLLAAISISYNLGIDIKTIKKAVLKLKSPEKTMKLVGKIKSANLVDDTFNTGSQAIKAALEYMKIYKGKKILILNPMIELGDLAQKEHEKAGEKCAQVCDLIFLTNLNYYSSFMKGAKKVAGDNKVKILEAKTLKNFINGLNIPDSIVLFEGKEAGRVLRQFI